MYLRTIGSRFLLLTVALAAYRASLLTKPLYEARPQILLEPMSLLVIGGLGGRPITQASLRRLFSQADQDSLGGLYFLDLNQEVVNRELERVKARQMKHDFGKAYVHFCPHCRKVIGISHRKGALMG